jgi:membrane associated rhomboid family serine protease
VAADPRPYVRAALGKAEKVFLVKVVLWIIAIFLVRPLFWRSPFFISVFILSAAGIYLLAKAHREGQTLRGVLRKNVMQRVAAGDSRGKNEPFPGTTFALVVVMALIYYVVEKAGVADAEFIRNNLVFLPLKVSWWNILASPFPSILLHGSAAQLWTGALFLWIFGPELEERIGGKKLIFLFIFSALAGKIIAVFAGVALFHQSYHGWGASPAVAGIMGAFWVRCYFLKPALRLPLPGKARSRLRVNPLLPMGLFFVLDLNAGFIALARDDSGIGQWTHFLSLAAGMLLALAMNLHGAAAEEKFIADGSAVVDHPDFFRGGESFFRAALEQDPENEAALLGLARMKGSSGGREGRDLFQRAIRSALRSSPERAVRLFREYSHASGVPLDPDLMYRLSGILYQEGDHEAAARSLESIVDGDCGAARLREKAFLQLISILAENNLQDAAFVRLRQFERTFPHSPLLASARKKCCVPE